MITRPLVSVAALLVATSPALLAHAGNHGSSFSAGAAHPLLGLDHVLAMIAVGWMGVRCARGAQGDRHALWLVPAAFVAAMMLGALLAGAGLAIPAAEWGIALSVLVCGLVVALANAPSTRIACAVAAVAAVLHSHAHVAEMQDASLASYMGGFVLSTILLHACGIAIAWRLAGWKPTSMRLAGAGVSLAGVWLLAGLIAG